MSNEVKIGASNSRGITRWMASMTKEELLAYADAKLMDRELMLDCWKRARRAMRPGGHMRSARG